MLKLFTYVDRLAELTKQEILSFLQDHQQFAFDADLLQPAAVFATRGKLFRGSLCLMVSQLLANQSQPLPGVWSVAVALELAGSAILIQDDVMDDSKMRRDEITLHRQYQRHWLGEQSWRSRFGESMSVCVSDNLFFIASRLLTLADLPAAVRLSLVETMGLEVATLAMAQAEELRFSALSLTHPAITEENIIQILIGKTARYTAMWPLKFASIICGVDARTAKALQDFGESLGLIFQLSDDRLGLFGDVTQTGKDTDGDARSGKKTLYALYARDGLTGLSKQRFMQLYGKSDLSATELVELQTLLKTNGICDQYDRFTTKQIAKAKHCLDQLNQHSELVSMLSETLDFVATRQR